MTLHIARHTEIMMTIIEGWERLTLDQLQSVKTACEKEAERGIATQLNWQIASHCGRYIDQRKGLLA